MMNPTEIPARAMTTLRRNAHWILRSAMVVKNASAPPMMAVVVNSKIAPTPITM
ncbi:Uncharacterised protein [Mycobacteroides abscessus subsp. abscessus]|nr:Uncharacterised protein [Mycobacteroides abscessus subsp. abscessus]